jgi:hypothetical protein
MSKEKFEVLKSKIVRSLKEHLYNDALPPSGERPVDFDIHVPFHQVHLDEDADNRATASVTYMVNCPSEKKHSVHVNFAYDKTGRYVKGSLVYV